MEMHFHAGFAAQFFEQQLAEFRVVNLAAGLFGDVATPLCQGVEDFFHDARFVAAIDDLGQQTGGPDSPEAAGDFDQSHGGTGAGGGEGGPDAGGAAAADDHVAGAGDRDPSGRLEHGVVTDQFAGGPQ